jgi:endoglucanase
MGSILAVLVLVGIVLSAAAVQHRPPDAFEQAKKLGKGVNLGNALEAPKEGDWGVVLQEHYFQRIREAGFDTVRVPIKWSAHAGHEPPYAIDEAFFRRIDWVVDQALKYKLNVVINMHHYDEIYQDPDSHRDRFIAMWEQIALRYRNKPDNVYFEPLNEPNGALDADKWNELLRDVLKSVRNIDRRHTLVVGGTEWNSIPALLDLDIPAEERNIVVTFHLYEPHFFTHQGAEWMSAEYATTHVIWPGPPDTPLEPAAAARKALWARRWFRNYNHLPYEENPAGPKPIIELLDMAERWSRRHNRPLWMGEFGAYSKADMQSRANWTAFVRAEAEKRGFSWAYWEFGAGFGVYDRTLQRFHEPLLRALIPESSGQPDE